MRKAWTKILIEDREELVDFWIIESNTTWQQIEWLGKRKQKKGNSQNLKQRLHAWAVDAVDDMESDQGEEGLREKIRSSVFHMNTHMLIIMLPNPVGYC